MGRKRLFSTAALTAMADTELTGLDWRIYLWVSLHDGMSLVKGRGAGCFASNKTIFAEADCDYSAGCRALSKLVDRGHLVRERVGRSTRYRVAFDAPDMLQAGNLSDGAKGCEPASESAAIYDRDFSESRRNLPKTARDYSPLSGELVSVETEELDSIEMAHRSDARFDDDPLSAASFKIDLSADRGKEPAEAGLGRGYALTRYLPPHLERMPIGAQVARIDQAYTQIGRQPELLAAEEREGLSEWLNSIAEEHMGTETDAIGQQAHRLREDLYTW